MAGDPGFDQYRRALARSRELAERTAEWHRSNMRQIEAAMQAVREPVNRAVAWIDANSDRINAVLKGLQAFNKRGLEIENEWKDAGLGYLVSPLGAAEQLFLSLHAEPGSPDELLDFLETALASSDFVAETCAALDGAQVLTDVSRDHLKHGLRHLEQREVFHAWPPLIIGLEGAFIDVAIARGIAVRKGNHVYLADPDGNPLPRKVPSVEGVAEKLGLKQDDFGEFLVRQVYGGDGDPFRHGAAQEGVRDRAVCLAFAVVGWLDAFVTPGSRELLREAIVAEMGRRFDHASDDDADQAAA